MDVFLDHPGTGVLVALVANSPPAAASDVDAHPWPARTGESDCPSGYRLATGANVLCGGAANPTFNPCAKGFSLRDPRGARWEDSCPDCGQRVLCVHARDLDDTADPTSRTATRTLRRVP